MCFSTHLQKMFIFLLWSHNASTHWTKVVIISCYHLLLDPKSNLSHGPPNTLFCFVCSDGKAFTKSGGPPEGLTHCKGYGPIPASVSPSLGSRGPSLFGGQYPLPYSCHPMQPGDKNTQEWALPGCIILNLSIQKAAPKLEGKLPLIEKRGHFRSLLHPWHDDSDLPMDAEYLTN